MTISRKLAIIVVLTILEVTLTVGAAFEISKGATFHQLNSLHLKYNALLSDDLARIDAGAPLDAAVLTDTVRKIRQQPVECLELVNALDRFIMRRIGTYYALALCESDIATADRLLASLDDYTRGDIAHSALVHDLHASEAQFHKNSAEFELPVAKTVTFILRTLIPAIIVISVFNIWFITYLSRGISSSIRDAVDLLRSGSADSLEDDVRSHISGELAELILLARDRVRSDAFNRELSAKLETEVRARTVSLERANEELTQFAYRTSHDLRGPLTTAKSLAAFIEQDIQAGSLDEALENARRVQAKMTSLEQLVDGILDLTRAEHEPADDETADLVAIVDDVRERLAGDGGLDYVAVTAHSDVTSAVPLQRWRLTQIVENLMSNAVKYRRASAEQPFVDFRLSEDEAGYELTVSDNGIGIPNDSHANVFGMFKRFHPKVGSGSGLGLAIVKKHVDRLNGTIGVRSTDAGTVFTIRFSKEGVTTQ